MPDSPLYAKNHCVWCDNKQKWKAAQNITLTEMGDFR